MTGSLDGMVRTVRGNAGYFSTQTTARGRGFIPISTVIELNSWL